MNQKTRRTVIAALALDLNVKCLPIDTHRLSTYVFNRMILLYLSIIPINGWCLHYDL